jgi:uncharacterized membrane protein YhaH (DUF805 family)
MNNTNAEVLYYFSKNGETFGPLNKSQLLTQITANTLVYREGIQWTNANEVEELKSYFLPADDIFINDNLTDDFINPLNNSQKMFDAPFSFNGRIRRKEYGITLIIYVIAYFIIAVLTEFARISLVGFVPLFWFLYAQGAKRCHDRGHSGWYQLIPFYVFWMIFAEGNKQNNKFGISPKS